MHVLPDGLQPEPDRALQRRVQVRRWHRGDVPSLQVSLMQCIKCSEREATWIIEIQRSRAYPEIKGILSTSGTWHLCDTCESMLNALIRNRPVFQRGTTAHPLIDALHRDDEDDS